MNRRARVLPLLLTPLLLTACGTEDHLAEDPAAAGTAATSSATASAAAGEAPPAQAPPAPDGLENRAKALGMAPELVYVTRVPGFTLAQQSVGVIGDDGFSATYVTGAGAMVRISVERGSMSRDTCRSRPVGDMSGERTTCEPEGGTLYRTGGGRHEYALPKSGHVVKVSADTDAVSREVLRGAAASVHRPGAAEAAATLPSPRPATTPVERGDLPRFGEGPPDNSVDVVG
ncbi:hypothetical protein [Streptomyces sp. AC627_RSS907]|uniref:hypothetical protein n=1 Tax=Streptomyces sp. AC627_RSS907 TaxID=2823684 RepID=UPI001C2205F5|nr:hypothetical protein [Streptomyces sp. AC627_RSS907]